MHTFAYFTDRKVRIAVDDSTAGHRVLVIDAGDESLRINVTDVQLERIEQACRACLEGKRKAPVGTGAGVGL